MAKEKAACSIGGCRSLAAFRVKLGPHDQIDVCRFHAKTLAPGTPESALEPIPLTPKE